MKHSRSRARMTFQRKLLVYSIVLSVFPVLTVGLLSSYFASRSVQGEADESHRYMLSQMQTQLNQFTKSLHINSIYIATNLAVEKSVRDGPGIDNLNASLEMNETIRRIRSTSPVRYNVSILYKRFNNYIYSNEYGPDTIARLRLPAILDKLKPVDNEAYVVPANTFDDQPELLLFRPVPINSDYSDGVVVLHVSPDDILQFVGSMEHGHGTRVLVADEKNRIVISSKREEMGRPLDDALQPGQAGGAARTAVIGGERYKVQAQKSSLNDWTYIAMTPMAELTAQSERIRLTTWIIAAALLIVWAIIAAVGSRRMYVPIQRLAERLVPRGRHERSRGDGLLALGDYVEHLADANRQLSSRLNEQFPYLKQGMFQQLLREEMSERELTLAAGHAGLHFRGTHVFVIVAEADDIQAFRQTYREKDRALIHYALLKMMEETFQGESVPFCSGFTPKTGRVVLLVGMDGDAREARDALTRRADEAREHVRTYFRFPVSVAIGRPLPGFADIGKGYDEASALLAGRFVPGGDVTIGAEQADEGLLRLSRQTVERQKRIVHDLLHGNLPDARKLLADIVAELAAAQVRPETAMGLFAYLLGELDYSLQQTGCDIQAADVDLYAELHRLRSLPELARWLSDELFPTIKELTERDAVSKRTKTIREVMGYARERVERGDDMTLQEAADRFRLSVSYLSKLFKDEAGLNFSEYVLELRLTKAKMWLEHTDMPIKDIAERTGYASVQNFNRVFKQRYDVPPGEYRKEKRQASG
ncbi:helix-turn-helix domain-containing protein [Paenibacillus flagellatus]|nr:helix-turn-helix domain-containing protein [Paenibacillus flagellatus]